MTKGKIRTRRQIDEYVSAEIPRRQKIFFSRIGNDIFFIWTLRPKLFLNGEWSLSEKSNLVKKKLKVILPTKEVIMEKLQVENYHGDNPY